MARLVIFTMLLACVAATLADQWDQKVLAYNAALGTCEETDDVCLQKVHDSIRDDVRAKVEAGELPTVAECDQGWLVAELKDPVYGVTYEGYLPC